MRPIDNWKANLKKPPTLTSVRENPIKFMISVFYFFQLNTQWYKMYKQKNMSYTTIAPPTVLSGHAYVTYTNFCECFYYLFLINSITKLKWSDRNVNEFLCISKNSHAALSTLDKSSEANCSFKFHRVFDMKFALVITTVLRHVTV